MCGIAGFLGTGPLSPEAAAATAREMADRLAHRGPDDAGVWLDPGAGAALAHRRLAVVDRSPAGHQPMRSASGQRVIVFNGEIYNHQDLRRRLDADRQGISWRGHSDTETLLAAIECWGLEEALRASTGMFALALWDREDRALWLARDRIGEKPLYYGWQNGVFLFGSELKALAAHPAFAGDVDRGALAQLLRHGHVSSPWSIYEGIRKLPPGTCVRMAAGAASRHPGDRPEPRPYWSLRDAVTVGRAGPFRGAPEEAADALDDRLLRAVRRQMVADVPLGAFLSGGIDSSAVVALMQAQSTRPVRTFTIGFDEAEYDEAPYARAVASHLGTEHTELYVSARQALDVVPRLPDLFDEPFADPSQIPTFLVAGMARRQVTVALSGDGGDELFGGYDLYSLVPRLWTSWRRRRLFDVPLPLRRLGEGAILALASGAGTALGERLLRRLPPIHGRRWTPDRLRKLAAMATSRTREEFYRRSRSFWPNPHAIMRGTSLSGAVMDEPASCAGALEFAEWMMAVDTLGYLPDDILVKVDRAAMAVSLETRAPFLDHDVVEFVWRLPLPLRIRGAEGKWILRQVLRKYLPMRLVDRPKAGFGVPLGSWLRGPLRDWAEALLDERRLREEGFFDPGPVRRTWLAFLKAHDEYVGLAQRLWNVLMFQAWLERFPGAGGGNPDPSTDSG